MSIPISQKVDLLYKQAFGVTKTDTEANKSPSIPEIGKKNEKQIVISFNAEFLIV